MRLCVGKENDCINLSNLCWKRYLSCVMSHVYSSTACIFWVHDWRDVCVEGIFVVLMNAWHSIVSSSLGERCTSTEFPIGNSVSDDLV